MEVVACDLCGSLEHVPYLKSKDFINKKKGPLRLSDARHAD